MDKELIELINKLGYDCYDIPNDYYLLQKNPGEYILKQLEKAGYKIIKLENK